MSGQYQSPFQGLFFQTPGNNVIAPTKWPHRSWWSHLQHTANLWQKLQDVIIIPDEVMQPMSHYSSRKAWESPYGPKYQQKGGEITVTTIKSTDNLPPKKWVLPRNDEETREQRTARRREMLAWLTDQKFKYQVCLVDIDNRQREVFLFKKEKLALMFKLAWG